MAKKVLLLSGPGGSGKTTIAELLVKKRGFILVDGDNLDTEFFPHGEQWLPKNTEKLARAHDKILREARKLFDADHSVVVDYIIFGRYLEFIDKFRKEFGDNFEMKILFPSKEEIVKRDKKRECWTTGEERIAAVRSEFEAIKNKIGLQNFLDTSGQTPEMTFENHFAL